MIVMEKSQGYEIDGRVSIAFDALDDEQKRAVGEVLTDRAHFLASTADSRKVRRISKNDSLFALSMPSGLRVIYSKSGDDIVVMDLMRKETLAKYGQRRSPRRKGPERRKFGVTVAKKLKSP